MLQEGNKTIAVTMTPFHTSKLSILCSRTGLSKTGVIQRLIEDAKLYAQEGEQLKQMEGDPGE